VSARRRGRATDRASTELYYTASAGGSTPECARHGGVERGRPAGRQHTGSSSEKGAPPPPPAPFVPRSLVVVVVVLLARQRRAHSSFEFCVCP